MGRTVVVGVGNRYRGDDGAGLTLAAIMQEHVSSEVQVLTLEGEPMILLELLEEAERVILVDAVSTDSRPGTIYAFDASEDPLPGAVFGASTHSFGLGETIEIARALGKLHCRLLVYGINGASFASGEGLSAEVLRAVHRTAAVILEDLSTPAPRPEPLRGASLA